MSIDLSIIYQYGQVLFGVIMMLLVLTAIVLFGLRWFKGR